MLFPSLSILLAQRRDSLQLTLSLVPTLGEMIRCFFPVLRRTRPIMSHVTSLPLFEMPAQSAPVFPRLPAPVVPPAGMLLAAAFLVGSSADFVR